MAWLGGWLGSPVLGHWWEMLRYEDIYLAPAFLGAFVAVFGTVLFFKAMATMLPAMPTVKPSVEAGKEPKAA